MTPRARLRSPASLVLRGLLAGALLSGQASAQSTPRAPVAPLSESLRGDARGAYESGKLLLTNHDFAGALTKFQQAYSLSSDPRLLYNMAICEKELRHYARMQALLQQYENDSGAALSSETRTAVDEALAAIRPLVGKIQVTATEDGAAVLLDGEAAGTTPLPTALSADLGKHTVVMKKDGFETAEQTVDSPGGGTVAVSITLVRRAHSARLVVAVDANAVVAVDGRSSAKGGFDAPVSPGTHHIGVTEAGKLPYTADVDLHDGETRTMDVSMVPEHSGSSVWPWIVGGAVVAAGAAVGGYFLFKPQTQTGPAPTGVIGGVTLAVFGR
jgi:hypothetical protein